MKTTSHRLLSLFFMLYSLHVFSQGSISGRVVNDLNNQPMAHVNVFIENSSIGTATNSEGRFKLNNIPNGKYKLFVSMVGFENYSTPVLVAGNDVVLPDVRLTIKTVLLKSVIISSVEDPNRVIYYGWFVKQFLGTSEFAQSCTILNPEVLDFNYNKTKNIFTASASDMIQIRNEALGYTIKYALNDFIVKNNNAADESVHFDGAAFFRQMKGTPRRQKRWEKNRRNAFEGSPMHFFRSLVGNNLNGSGFRAIRIEQVPNPDRPNDSLIQQKIDFFTKNFEQGKSYQDSLKAWKRKQLLPKKVGKVIDTPVRAAQLVKRTDQRNVFAFDADGDQLFISYNRHHHYEKPIGSSPLNSVYNTDNSMVTFNSPYAFFNHEGQLSDPESLTFSGVWGRRRVGDLLPADFDINKNNTVPLLRADTLIQSRLNELSENPREQVYLQFNKSGYLSGESIYFKAYLTEGWLHKPSDLSRVLHVNLINRENKIVQSLLLRINNGVARGDIALPDSIPPGWYKVDAYTQYMRVVSSCYDNQEFEQFIRVYQPGRLSSLPANKTNKVKLVELKQAKPMRYDIQFLPEGGMLLCGHRCKVAFKAIDTTGYSVSVSGTVLDNDSHQVAEFASSHLGMGWFYLSPEAGKSYHAKVMIQGKTMDIPLPKAALEGIGISVSNDSSEVARVTVYATGRYFKEHKNEDYSLAAYCGESSINLPCKLTKRRIEIDLDKKLFPSGIVQLTLLSPNLEPLSERLIFVVNFSDNCLSLDNKESYPSGSSITFRLHAQDINGHPVTNGQFSVAVNNADRVPVDRANERTILTTLLLSGDLRGYIEDPNYYFNNITARKLQYLDLLMLTHGYRGFSLLSDRINELLSRHIKPEEGLQITGRILNFFNHPINHGLVNLLSTDSTQRLRSTITDSLGRFKFSNLSFNNGTVFIVNATGPKSRGYTKIQIDKPSPETLSAQWRNSNERALIADSTTDKMYAGFQLPYLSAKHLKEVKIVAPAYDNYKTLSLAGAGNADQVVHSKNIGIGGPLTTALNGILRGVTFFNINGQELPFLTDRRQPMLVVLDGVEGADITNIDAHEVETVEVLKYASAAMYGMAGANGVLVVTTKTAAGKPDDSLKPIGLISVSPPGFYKARSFYSPKYIVHSSGKNQEAQTAIFWKPDLSTDEHGNATISFNNSAATAKYSIVIDGFDNNGNLYHKVFRYKVK